jgi:diguanylate cyclase
MPFARSAPRVLVIVDRASAPVLDHLFGLEPLANLEPAVAADFAAARFALEHNPCDVLLVDGPVFQRNGPEAFEWLGRRHLLPTVVVTETEAAVRATDQTLIICLPRPLAIARPETLREALSQAVRLRELQRSQLRLSEALKQSRRQTDRLVALVWRTLPDAIGHRWLSQHDVLERLEAEMARATRYGNPLTVARAEVQTSEVETRVAAPVIDWVAEAVAGAKRWCDVAGKYGTSGFLLVLVNTSAEGGIVCCRRLQRVLTQTKPSVPGPNAATRACFGLATASADGPTLQGILYQAEEHLEAAKTGKNHGLVAG